MKRTGMMLSEVKQGFDRAAAERKIKEVLKIIMSVLEKEL